MATETVTLTDLDLFTGANDVARGDRVLVERSGTPGAALMQGALTLPAVTTADSGKYLRVNGSGEWATTTGTNRRDSVDVLWTGSQVYSNSVSRSYRGIVSAESGENFLDYDDIAVIYSFRQNPDGTGNGVQGMVSVPVACLTQVTKRPFTVASPTIAVRFSLQVENNSELYRNLDSFAHAVFPTSVVASTNWQPVTVSEIWGVKRRYQDA